MMKVLMIGVDKKAVGGMWTVVENYLDNKEFCKVTNLKYIATATSDCVIKKIIFSAKGLLKVIKSLLFQNIDIVHVHMAERGSVFREGLVVLLGKLFNKKVIIHMHGATIEDWYLSQNKLMKKIVVLILNKCDKFIILGELWKKFASTIIRDKNKIEVLYNSVKIPDHNKYNSESKNIIFLGMLIERKGIYDLLDAISIIRDRLGRDIKIKLYGSDKEGNINEKIVERNLENLVEYCGWITDRDKELCFKEAMINILPSYNEGLPMSIIETMSYGIPNISTSIAAIPEAITNGIEGVLIKPGEIEKLGKSILDLVNNENLRKEYSKNSYNKISSKFDISVHIRNLIKIYN